MQYNQYIYSFKEKAIIVMEWFFISALFSYFFYRSFIAFAIFFLLLPIYFRMKQFHMLKKLKWKLTLQFKDAIQAISTSLIAGLSVENAFQFSLGEMISMYGKNEIITKELFSITKGLENNRALEEMLMDFAQRTSVEEIKDFADVFSIAKRSGGNLKDIMERTSTVIGEKVEMKREIRVLVSAKELEHKIMCGIPFFILSYIGLTSKGFFDSLYHNLSGIGVMTFCLLLYLIAFLWGKRIVNISK